MVILYRYQSNWDKVSLSFTPYTPMAYNRKREQHLCFFLITPEIAARSDVIFTDSNATRNDHRRGQGLAGLNNVQFNVIKAIPLFTDSPKASSRTIGFSYAHELMIRDTKASKNMLYSTQAEENRFSKSISDKIIIVASVRVITGTQARISLLDTVTNNERIIMNEELPRSNEYKHESIISLEDLPVGIYLVKYNLGEACWAASRFEVVP